MKVKTSEIRKTRCADRWCRSCPAAWFRGGADHELPRRATVSTAFETTAVEGPGAFAEGNLVGRVPAPGGGGGGFVTGYAPQGEPAGAREFCHYSKPFFPL